MGEVLTHKMFAWRGHSARYAAIHLNSESYAIVTCILGKGVNQGLRDANREGDGTGGSATQPKLKKGDVEDKIST
jgi:hypothetical protein